MDFDRCITLIRQTLVPDTQVQIQAKKAIEEAKEKFPDQFLIGLCMICKDVSQDPGVRLAGLLELRRSVTYNKIMKTPWEDIQAGTKEEIKKQVLELTLMDNPRPFIRHIIDLVGNLATSVMKDSGSWSDLTNLLGEWIQSPNETQKESALKIFSSLLTFKVPLEPFYEFMSKAFLAGLSDPSVVIRIASLEASIFLLVKCKPFREQFANMIPNCFEIVTVCLNNDKEELAVSALELLIQLVDIHPLSIERYVDAVLDITLAIASQSAVPENVRYLTLEIIACIGEGKPTFLRDRIPFLKKYVNLLLSMMSQITDNPEWNLGEEHDEEDEEVETGNSYLDRLALSVRDPVIGVLFENIPSMLSNENWKIRHTAIMAISLVGEGCADVMKPKLNEVINAMLPSFRDPHERVRWATCNSIGQMATDFAPSFQKKFHEPVIQSLIMTMNDTNNPRVQSYAAAAIINFAEDCKGKILIPYLQPLLGNLLQLLKSSSALPVEQAITATGAVADCVGKAFTPYTDEFLPVLMVLITGKGPVDNLTLRAKSIEAVSLIAAAVSKKAFMPYSSELMNILLQLEGTLPEDDPRVSLLQRSWGKFAKALGKEFGPILPTILPRILRSASLEADVKILKPEEQEDDKWQLLDLDEQNVLGINTTVIQEKSAAMTLLYWLAFELEDVLIPFINDLLPLAINGIEFFYHDAVRTAAFSIIPCLVRATKTKVGPNHEDVAKIFLYTFPFMVKAISNELYPEVLLVMLDALEECITAAGPCMSNTELQDLSKLLDSILQSFNEKRTLHIHTMETNEDGAYYAEKELDKQHEILIKVGEISGKCLEVYGEKMLPYLSNVTSYYDHFLTNGKYDAEVQISVCYFDDLVEFGGPQAANIYQKWIPTIVKLMQHPHADVRQSVVYGLGVLAEFNPNLFKPVLGDSLNGCNHLITMEGSRDDEHINVTENAISAVGKVIQFHSDSIDLNVMLPAWLSYLPVSQDDGETIVIYKQLCDFMMKYSSIVLGNNFERLPAVLSLLIEILGTELISEDTNPVIINIIKTMQNELPGDKMQQAFQSLSAVNQEKARHIA